MPISSSESTAAPLSFTSPLVGWLWQTTPPRAPGPLNLTDEESALLKAAREEVRRRQSRRDEPGDPLLDETGQISAATIEALGQIGWWGLRIDSRFGGQAASMRSWTRLLREMAIVEPAIAGLTLVHGCLGAAAQIQTFGSSAQQERWLPQLAAGRPLSIFALTEPQAGSDLRRLATTAKPDGGTWRLRGEKLFITAARPGRLAAVVARVDQGLGMFAVELPEAGEHLRYRHYRLHAAGKSGNNGLLFSGLPVADEQRIAPERDALELVYHGLNRGRVSLAAITGGKLRRLLQATLEWAQRRTTFGEPIANRELVQTRLGRMAAGALACDVLSDWAAATLDAGGRGETEAMVAKIVATEAERLAATDWAFRTLSGRALVRGNPLGDSLHDHLAPSIYEGENELLGLALVRTLLKQRPDGAGDHLVGLEVLATRTGNVVHLADFLLGRWRRQGPEQLAADQIYVKHWASRFLNLVAAELLSQLPDESAALAAAIYDAEALAEAIVADEQAALLGKRVLQDGFPGLEQVPAQGPPVNFPTEC